MHARKQIRKAATAILTGLETTGEHAYPTKVHPIDDTNLPCLSIYTGEDELEQDFTDDDGDAFRLQLLVRISVKETAVLEDEIDAIAVEVQKALAQSGDLGGLVHDLQLLGSEPESSDEAERKVGRRTLLYEVIYQIPDDDPETLIL